MKKLMIMVPNLQGGGQERIAALMSRVLENDYEIFFVVFDDKESKYEVSEKAKFVNINVPSAKGIFAKGFNVVKRTAKIRSLRKKEKIDCCLSMGCTANIINCLSRGSGRTIVSVRNSSTNETGKRSVINNLIYKKSDTVLCVSEGQMLKIQKVYPEINGKAYVVYNPCDIEKIAAFRESITESEKMKHVVVACGRLEGMKCYKNLFNSIKLVRKKIDDVRLMVIGEGTQRRELEEYIRDNQLDAYIELMGFKDDPFQYVAKGEIFAFTSAREGFPNVLVEALASGVPVISTDCEYGPREILSGKWTDEKIEHFKQVDYGVLTPPFVENKDHQEKEEAELATGIIQLMTSEELLKKMMYNGVRRANDFSLTAYKEKIMRVL